MEKEIKNTEEPSAEESEAKSCVTPSEETAAEHTEAVLSAEAATDLSETSEKTDKSDASPQSKGKVFLQYLKKFANRYFIVAFGGMANGLFCTLIAGTIICQLARIFGDGSSQNEILNICYRFLNGIGTFAKVMMGAGIGVGIAYSLKSSKMAMACSVAVGVFSAHCDGKPHHMLSCGRSGGGTRHAGDGKIQTRHPRRAAR